MPVYITFFWDFGTTPFDKTNPASMNEVFRNYGDWAGKTNQYDNQISYKSGFLNFQGINNMYLSSPNLGCFNTVGPRGEQTIINTGKFRVRIYDHR